MSHGTFKSNNCIRLKLVEHPFGGFYYFEYKNYVHIFVHKIVHNVNDHVIGFQERYKELF
jgi:hypothetical protein